MEAHCRSVASCIIMISKSTGPSGSYRCTATLCTVTTPSNILLSIACPSLVYTEPIRLRCKFTCDAQGVPSNKQKQKLANSTIHGKDIALLHVDVSVYLFFEPIHVLVSWEAVQVASEGDFRCA